MRNLVLNLKIKRITLKMFNSIFYNLFSWVNTLSFAEWLELETALLSDQAKYCYAAMVYLPPHHIPTILNQTKMIVEAAAAQWTHFPVLKKSSWDDVSFVKKVHYPAV